MHLLITRRHFHSIFVSLVLTTTSLVGAGLAGTPTLVAVVTVPSEFDSFMVSTGNIRVTFSNGRSELWTERGNCISPRLSSKGEVGWVQVDKSKVDLPTKSRHGKDELVVRLLDGSRRTFLTNPEAPFIGNWNFTDNASAVAIQSAGYHGPRSYIKYDIETGKVKDEINAYGAYDTLPSWAKELSDE